MLQNYVKDWSKNFYYWQKFSHEFLNKQYRLSDPFDLCLHYKILKYEIVISPKLHTQQKTSDT
jgi:hypothetical protein